MTAPEENQSHLDKLFKGGTGHGSDPGFMMGPEDPDNDEYWRIGERVV